MSGPRRKARRGMNGQTRSPSPTKARAQTSLGFVESNSPYSLPVPNAATTKQGRNASPPRARQIDVQTDPSEHLSDSIPTEPPNGGTLRGETLYFKRKDGSICPYRILSTKKTTTSSKNRLDSSIGSSKSKLDQSVASVDPGAENDDKPGKKQSINIVVIHDMFHTLEQLVAFFRPILASAPHLNVLVWNCPGQANTVCGKDVVPNNDYSARTLHDLLWYLELNKAFHACSEEFVLLGLGRGANIALYFSIFFMTLPLRCLILVNPYLERTVYMNGLLDSWKEALSFAARGWTSSTFAQLFAHLLVSPQHCISTKYPNLLKALNRPLLHMNRQSWKQMIDGFGKDVTVKPALSKLERPFVVLQSRHNRLVPKTATEEFVNTIPGGTSVESVEEVLDARDCTYRHVYIDGGHDILRHSEGTQVLEQLFRDIAEKYTHIPGGAKELTKPSNLMDEIDRPDDEPITIDGFEIPDPDETT